MANVLTDLAADLYKAADVVGREQVGMVPSVTLNAGGSERAAVGDTVRSHFTRAAVAGDNTPSMTIPEGTDQTVDNKTLSITKSRGVPIPWTGEDVMSVNNGSGYETIYGDQIAQAMRTLTNEIETDSWAAAYVASSRAFGTAGTTPFVSTLVGPAQVRKILVDNGAAMSDASLIIDSTAGANLRTLTNLTDVGASGTDSTLRQGILLPLSDLSIRESAKITTHTAGTGTSYTSAATGYAIGTTSIPIITGSGTVLAGDVVTFAGDTNKYIVTTGVAAPGTIVIAEPGLKVALAASAVAMTIGATYTGNIALERSAFEIAMRAPAMPPGGDAAVDSMMIVDDRSGLVFDVSVYKGFQKTMVNVSAAWGVKAWKPESIATLLG